MKIFSIGNLTANSCFSSKPNKFQNTRNEKAQDKMTVSFGLKIDSTMLKDLQRLASSQIKSERIEAFKTVRENITPENARIFEDLVGIFEKGFKEFQFEGYKHQDIIPVLTRWKFYDQIWQDVILDVIERNVKKEQEDNLYSFYSSIIYTPNLKNLGQSLLERVSRSKSQQIRSLSEVIRDNM